MGYKKIHFTRHAIDRYRERFPAECKNKTDGDIRRNLYVLACNSKPDRSFINNSRYMMRLYDQYGYDLDFEFLRYENLIFVAKKEENRRVILTCYPSDNWIFGKRIKFKKKKKASKEILNYLLTN